MQPERSFTVAFPCAGHEVGDTVTEAELEGCNVDALVASGHLTEAGVQAPTTEVIPPPPANAPTPTDSPDDTPKESDA